MAKRLVQLTDEAAAAVANYGSPDHPEGLIPYSALTVEHVDWVIPGHVPLGMLTVLAGEQGLGKSLLHASWASTLSKQEQPSILVSAEDSPTHTTKARLMAYQANQDAIYHANILPVLGNGNDEAWLARLRKWILNTDARLLVFDPLSAFLDANTDSYKDQHVRRILAELDAIARETGCAIVYVMHLTKGAGANPMQRIAGSIAFTAAARSVVMLTADTDPMSPLRLLGHVKCNVGEKAVPQRWKIMPILIPNVEGRDVKTARIEYVEEAADVDMFTILVPRDPETAGEIEEACALIRSYVAVSDVPSRDLMEMLNEHGISEKTAKRARSQVGVEVEKRGKVWWCLRLSQSKRATMKGATPPWPPSFPPNHAGSEDAKEGSGPSVGDDPLPAPDLSQSPIDEWDY